MTAIDDKLNLLPLRFLRGRCALINTQLQLGGHRLALHSNRFNGFLQPLLFLTVAMLLGLSFRCWAVPATFSNPNPIVINDTTNPPTKATPYPSPIVVTGLTASVIAKVTVQLNNFAHTYPDDVDIVLVGPQGQNSVVLSNVGGGHPGATNITLVLDDDAPASLPLTGPLVSGTFKPTKRLPSFAFAFPGPAPAVPGDASLAVFNGTDPNGTWNLFVVDDANPDSGIILGGWSISISTTPVLLTITPVGTNVVLSWTNALVGFNLQTSPSLTAPMIWTNATPAAVTVAGQFTVTNQVAGPSRFYRLTR